MIRASIIARVWLLHLNVAQFGTLGREGRHHPASFASALPEPPTSALDDVEAFARLGLDQALVLEDLRRLVDGPRAHAVPLHERPL
jgi:hypothetical protein